MKTLKTIGTVMMLAGMGLMLTTVDGSETQIAQVLIGLALFGGGAFLSKSFDFQQGGAK
jgi:hypothetical protein